MHKGSHKFGPKSDFMFGSFQTVGIYPYCKDPEDDSQPKAWPVESPAWS